MNGEVTTVYLLNPNVHQALKIYEVEQQLNSQRRVLDYNRQNLIANQQEEIASLLDSHHRGIPGLEALPM
jgi:MinD-like ATPase involved in chromosome partitioning or flagellar assembly